MGGRDMNPESILNRLSPEARYVRDPEFAALVNSLLKMIEEGKYTPTELREACILAATQYEYRNSRRLFFIGDKCLEPSHD